MAVHQNVNQPKQQSKTEQTSIVYSLGDINSAYSQLYTKYNDNYNVSQTFYSSNPYIQNQRIKSLSTRSSFQDRENVEKHISQPGSSEMPLRGLSWDLMSSTYQYYKMLKMYSDILTYNHYVYPEFVDKEVMSTRKFQLEEKLVSRYIDKINPKYTFRRITLETLVEGKRAYIIRDSFDKKTGEVDFALLQALPSDFWKVTSKTQDSYYGISFDFTYFWQPGTSIDQFPPVFKEYYELLYPCVNVVNNIVSLKDKAKIPENVNVEFDSSVNKWFFWTEIPADLVWVFSIDESTPNQVPPFTGLFLQLQDLNSYQYLQTQLASIPLYGILTGEVPMADKNKSGNHINDFAISPEVYAGEEYRANASVPPGVAAVYSPIKNVQFHQFKEQVNSSKIYTDVMQQTIATAGLTGLQSTTDKPTIAMIKASEKIEGRFIDFIYQQFKHFMNTVFETRLVTDYKWTFDIFGTIFRDKEDSAELLNKINGGHHYLLPKLLAYEGYSINTASCISDYVDASKLYDKLKVPPTAFTQSGAKPDGNGAGRKELSDDEVENDNTAISKENGTNKSENRE